MPSPVTIFHHFHDVVLLDDTVDLEWNVWMLVLHMLVWLLLIVERIKPRPEVIGFEATKIFIFHSKWKPKIVWKKKSFLLKFLENFIAFTHYDPTSFWKPTIIVNENPKISKMKTPNKKIVSQNLRPQYQWLFRLEWFFFPLADYTLYKW